MCGAGVRYFGECPLSLWIPLELIIGGVFLLCAAWGGAVIACVAKFAGGKHDGFMGVCMIGEGLVCCIAVLWIFAG